jgi:iron complex transport system permease protein
MTTAARSGHARLTVLLVAAGLGVAALFLFSFTLGPYPIPAATVVSVFLHRLDLVERSWSDAVELVVLDVRGPRIAAALLIGGALASAGAT